MRIGLIPIMLAALAGTLGCWIVLRGLASIAGLLVAVYLLAAATSAFRKGNAAAAG